MAITELVIFLYYTYGKICNYLNFGQAAYYSTVYIVCIARMLALSATMAFQYGGKGGFIFLFRAGDRVPLI